MWPRGVVPTPSAEVRRAGVRPLLDGARPSAGAGLSRVGRDVGEEVSGGARRGREGGGIGPLGREPEMGEDPADHPGILNGHDQAHAPPTARTRAHVTLDGAPHEVRPRPIARRAGRLLLHLHVAARARANGTCCHQRGRRALVGHGAGTPASMGGQGRRGTARDCRAGAESGRRAVRGVPGARRGGGPCHRARRACAPAGCDRPR